MKIEDVIVGETYAYTDHPFQRRTRDHVRPACALVLAIEENLVKVRMPRGVIRDVDPHGLQHTWKDELSFREELKCQS